MKKRMTLLGSFIAMGAIGMMPACGGGVEAPIDRAVQAVHEGDDSFDVDFAGCREVANVGQMPTANARPLVPSQFTLVGGNNPMTPFVVRSVHCDSISVDGKEPRSGNLLQIGLLIVAPDGDGDINNYTLYYDTTLARLSGRLRHVGVPARVVPPLQESIDTNADGSGTYHFAVPAPFDPPLSFDGPVGAPVGGPIPFVANWWASSDDTVKMNSTFPQLFTAGDSVTLTVPSGTPLASLLGTTTVSSWPVLALFDHFPTAHMHVTVR